MENNFLVLIYLLIYLWDVSFFGKLFFKLININFDSKVEKFTFEFALGNLVFSYVFHYLGMFHLLYNQLILVLFLIPVPFLVKRLIAIEAKYEIKKNTLKLLNSRWEISEILITLLLCLITTQLVPQTKQALIIILAILSLFSIRKLINLKSKVTVIIRLKKLLKHKIENAEVVIALFLLLISVPLIPHLFAFPTAWDVLAYHLTLPKVFLSAHYFAFYEWMPNTLMPVGIESLFSLGEILKEPRLANFIVFSFIAVFVVYILYGLRKLMPKEVLFIALVVFIFRKILFTEVSVAPFVDFPTSFYTFLMAIVLIKYIKSNNWKMMLILLIFSLFIFLAKYALGLIFIFSTMLVLIMHAFFNKHNFGKMVRNMTKREILLFISLTGISLIPIVYWLLRNFIYTHNPINPFFNPFWNQFFPVLGYDKANYEASLATMRGSSPGLDKLLSLFFLIPVKYPGLDEVFVSAVVFVFSIAGIFSRNNAIRYIAVFAIISIVPIYWMTGFPSYRYSLPAAVILALVASYMFFNLIRKPLSLFRLPLIIIFVASFVVQMMSTFGYERDIMKESFDRVTGGLLSYKEAVKNMYGQDNFANIDFVNKNLNKDKDKILVVFDNRLYYFNISAEYAVQAVNGYFTNPNTKTIEEIYTDIKEQGFTHLFVNNNWGVYGNLRKDLYYPFVDKYLQPVSTISGTVVYKLK